MSERQRYPEYRVRHHPDRGYYVICRDGHLAHILGEDGRARAAFFEDEAEAQRVADDMAGQMT